MATSKPRIAFFGLGLMGGGMARRLLESGYEVALYNRNRQKAEALAAAGAQIASTPAEATVNADVAISMVADDVAAKEIWLGLTGAASTAKQGLVCIESSTVSVAWIHELAAAVRPRGCDVLDCPVTGSRNEAATGNLKFICGGSSETLGRVRAVLSTMGRDIVHLGPLGSGAQLKLINNSLNAVHVAAFAQALALVETTALDTKAALEVILNGASASPIVKTVAARMLARDYTPHFSLNLLVKDVRYACEMGAKLQRELFLANTALELFIEAQRAGYGEQDIASVAEMVRAK